MLKIAIAQIEIKPAKLKLNYENIKKNIEKALEKQQNMIIFPEMSLPGYFIGDTWEQNSFLKECEYYHEKIAQLSDNILVVFGSVGCHWQARNEDGRVRKYNAVYCAYKKKLLVNSKTQFQFWPKTLMPNYREFDDSRHFFDLRKLAFEKNCFLIDLYEPLQLNFNDKIYSIGLSVCEDAWCENYSLNPVEIFNAQYKHDFFLNLSASPYTFEKNKRREIIFSKLAQKIQTPIFYINGTGVQNIGKTIYGFDGASAVYLPEGSIHKYGSSFEEHLSCIELGSEFNLRNDYNNQISNEKLNALEYILKKTARQWGIEKIVVGVSGGIDSALSAVLMNRVFGHKNVYLVNMPSQFNSSLTIDAAKQLALNLNCSYATISIQNSIEHTSSQLNNLVFINSHEKIKVTNFVFENIQARDRGSRILAALAAALGGAFTCNANKTELSVGYGTMYGDLAGFICPLGDLWKHEVYELAHFYNDHIFKKEVIPKVSLEVVPSAELSREQDVTVGKGDPLIYEYHDYLFKSWVEHWERKTPQDCLEAYINNSIDEMLGCKIGLSKKLFPTKELFYQDAQRWWKAYKGLGAVKRMQSPPIIALSRRAFGFDYRENI